MWGTIMNELDELLEGFLGPLHDGQMKHPCAPQLVEGVRWDYIGYWTKWPQKPGWTRMSLGIGVPHLSY